MAVPDTLKFDAEEPLFCDLRNRGIAPGNSANTWHVHCSEHRQK